MAMSSHTTHLTKRRRTDRRGISQLKQAEAEDRLEKQRLAQEQLLKEEAYRKIVVILSRAEQREQNMRYQRFRLAWAHCKAEAEVRVYLRRPANRLWDSQRKQQRSSDRSRQECNSKALSAPTSEFSSMCHQRLSTKASQLHQNRRTRELRDTSRQCRAECNLAHSGANQVQCRQAQGSASDSEAHSD